MSNEEKAIIDEWFARKAAEGYGTYKHDGKIDGEYMYIVDYCDFTYFTNFITEHFPDLVGIACVVTKSGIWFRGSDLDKASFY